MAELPKDESHHMDAEEQSADNLRDRIENFARDRIKKLMGLAPPQSDKRLFLMSKISSGARELFSGRDDLLDKFLRNTHAARYENDEELAAGAGQEMANDLVQLTREIGPREFERRYRKTVHEAQDFVVLDRDAMFAYSRFGDTVDLHMGSVETIPRNEKNTFLRERFSEAMEKLADIVRADDEIRDISMASWIVAKYPRMIHRKLGFADVAISKQEEAEIRANLPLSMGDKALAKAHMTREEFLQKYGSQDDKSDAEPKP